MDLGENFCQKRADSVSEVSGLRVRNVRTLCPTHKKKATFAVAFFF
jgi:hypothetical protein